MGIHTRREALLPRRREELSLALWTHLKDQVVPTRHKALIAEGKSRAISNKQTKHGKCRQVSRAT